MNKKLFGSLIAVALLAVVQSASAASLIWDVNGAVGGYAYNAYGTGDRAGYWDDTSTNWTSTTNGDGPTAVWTNNAWPATTPDTASFQYRAYSLSPGTGTLQNADIRVTVVGTRYSGIVKVDNLCYVVWTGGVVNLQATATGVQVGQQTAGSTFHVFSDLQIGFNSASQTYPRDFNFQVGAYNQTGSSNNVLILEGAIYASGPTGSTSVGFVPSAYYSGVGTKVILKAGSVISNGTASTLDAAWGNTAGNAQQNGRVEIYSTNTYTGNNWLYGGKTVVYANSLSGQAGAFGNATTELQFGRAATTATNQVELLTGTGGITIGRNVLVRRGGANNTTYGAILGGEHTSGTSIFSGQITLTEAGYARSTAVYLTSASGGTVDFNGNIINGTGSSNTPITKIGLGTVRLAAANTYSGPTTVTEGTLLVNGSIGTGAVTVAAGGTLGGTGTVNGATTVNGTLSPGQSPGGLTFNSDLTLAGTSTNYFEINGASDPNIDYVVVNGALAYGGILSVHFGYSPAPDASFQLFDFSGSQSGAFSDILVTGDYTGAVDFDVATGVLTVIPEPGTLGILSIGLIATLLRRRMRNA